MIGVHKNYIDRKICYGAEDNVHIHAARMDPEHCASAERAYQQLALHLIGVGDQNANRTRNANA
jgi:hypothetical protein